MSNEEIKALMLELTEHLNKATEVVEKLNTNYKQSRWSAPHILAARIDCNHGEPFKAYVHTSNVVGNVLQGPTKIKNRDCDVYPYEIISELNNVEFFELAEKNEVKINDAV